LLQFFKPVRDNVDYPMIGDLGRRRKLTCHSISARLKRYATIIGVLAALSASIYFARVGAQSRAEAATREEIRFNELKKGTEELQKGYDELRSMLA
jgi:hypothetical protein